MSNREMKNLLAVYVKEKFMTSSLIQNAWSFARDEIFGDLFQIYEWDFHFNQCGSACGASSSEGVSS